MNDYLASRAYSRKLEEEADALGLEVSEYVSLNLASILILNLSI